MSQRLMIKNIQVTERSRFILAYLANSRAITPKCFIGSDWLSNLAEIFCQQTISHSFMIIQWKLFKLLSGQMLWTMIVCITCYCDLDLWPANKFQSKILRLPFRETLTIMYLQCWCITKYVLVKCTANVLPFQLFSGKHQTQPLYLELKLASWTCQCVLLVSSVPEYPCSHLTIYQSNTDYNDLERFIT